VDAGVVGSAQRENLSSNSAQKHNSNTPPCHSLLVYLQDATLAMRRPANNYSIAATIYTLLLCFTHSRSRWLNLLVKRSMLLYWLWILEAVCIPISSTYRCLVLRTTPSDSGHALYQYSLGSPIGSDRVLYWLRRLEPPGVYGYYRYIITNLVDALLELLYLGST